jgi:precorrin-6B methylase 2
MSYKTIKTLLSMCKKPDNVVLHVKKAKDVLEHWTGFDFVFIDGNHNIEAAGAELLMVLRHEIPTVMAHDTNLSYIDSNYDGKGAELLGRVLKSHKDYIG